MRRTNVWAPGAVDQAATAYAFRKACIHCGAHMATPEPLADGRLRYECPMGHYWYEDTRRDRWSLLQ